MADRLDIGEVAARSGMAPSALRYYEGEGLIVSRERRGLRRQYAPEVLDTLAVVAMCQRAGFTLAEITTLLATGGEPAWKELATAKRDELRRQARHLTTMADQLDHALGCQSPPVFECEHFPKAARRALPVSPGRPEAKGRARRI